MTCPLTGPFQIGLIASKTCATPVRGQYYGIAAATGKIGAYVAVWVFPAIEADGGADVNRGYQDLFWVSSALAVFAGLLVWFCLPEINQDTIDYEDRRFRAYLLEHGYDTSAMGLTGKEAPVVPGYESDSQSDDKVPSALMKEA